MSGHSKWANIKNKKAKTDSQKAVVFQRYSRELIVAARLGGADPAGNFRLRTAIEKAKAAGLPNDNIKRAIKSSNYVSLHIPANEQTKKSINYKLLSQMPQGACLVNTARKEVIDEEDLAKILEDRSDFKYITDIAPDSVAVLKEKFGNRIFATAKKMGAQTAEANLNAGLAAANQIVDFLKNGNERFRVNK